MRVGVIGCGYWGSKHVRVFAGLPQVDHVVAIDFDESRLKSVAQSFPSVDTYTDVDAALDAVDALVVATPPASHHGLALEAIQRGKHVLIEKPMATSVADAVELVEAAEQAGVTLMVGHTFEYNPAVWHLRELMQEGELGDVYYIDAARLNLGLYQPDVNVVWDLAPHDISIMNHLLGGRPTAVEAHAYSCADSRFLDVAYINLEYGHLGVDAHIHVSWLDPCKVRRTTVVGSKKMAVYNDVATEEKIRIFDKGVSLNGDHVDQDTYTPPMTYRYGSVVSPYVDFKEPLRLEDEHFVECLATGKTPATDGYNGLAVVEALEAAERSIQQRRAVRLQQQDLVKL